MHHPPPFSGKRLRVMHTTNIASKMPRSFSVQSQGEARVLEYVQVWEGKGGGSRTPTCSPSGIRGY